MLNWKVLATYMLCIQGVFTQNAVPNPDFENTNGTFCGILSSSDYGTTVSNWSSPTAGSPDLFFTNNDQTCWNFQPNSTYPGPIGLKGPQLPRSGNVMSGIFLYTIPSFEQREYIQVQLTSPLVVGGKYVVECYVSLADYTESATDRLGMYLSTSPVWSGLDNVLNYTPQVMADGVISNTQDWVRVVDTLIVSEAYSYLTIGNFSSDALTTTVTNPTGSGQPGTYGSYYFIDDVRIERVLGTSGIEEFNLSTPERSVVKIIDLMGRETTYKANTPLILIYSDGTRERVLTLEN